jgi:hypothetical protein
VTLPAHQRVSITAVVAVVLLSACITPCVAGTTVDATHHSAYGANIGWFDARGDVTHGAVFGQAYCSGSVWSANCGWLGLGNGPTNGWRYSNASADDWGVNHDDAGRLSGYAYGANIGWVVFEQAFGRPRVDLRTGDLSGHVWSANVGWISLSNDMGRVRTTLTAGPDQDGDGLADAYEYRYTNSLAVFSGLNGHDADGDGASDEAEAGADTNPSDPSDRLWIMSLDMAGGTNRIIWTARPKRLYRLEATNTLAGAGTWSDVGQGVLGPSDVSCLTQWVSAVSITTRFYRVQAIIPLMP